jgi:hypothetical protein
VIARLSRLGDRCRSALRSGRLLIRVLFVALRGLCRSWWKRDPAVHPAFRRARDLAYRQLWAKLDDVYWALRARNGDAAAVRALLRNVSVFTRDNFLYVRDADRVLFSQYILSLHRLRAAVCPWVTHEAAARGGTAQPGPTRFVDVNTITQEAVDLRNRVLHKMRRALSSV